MEDLWISLKNTSNVVPAVQPAWLYIHSCWDISSGDGTQPVQAAWCDDLYPVLAYATGIRKRNGNSEGLYLVSCEYHGPVWVVHTTCDVTTVLYSHGIKPTRSTARADLEGRFPDAFCGEEAERTHPLEMESATSPEFVV